jgi:Kdo2-lipid IVA lauroyltransferase/acyltransferase
MRSRRKELEASAGAYAFRKFQTWIGNKSPLQAELVGARLGRIAFKLSKKHRNRALSNLRLAFPDWTEERLHRTARQVMEHFGRVTADFMRTPHRTREEMESSMSVEGLEHAERALERGRGFILITGHFGNWERLAHWLTLHGFKLSVVARDANDNELNERVLGLRTAAGVTVIPRGNAARPILIALKKNEVVGILPDQNSGEMFVPFFDRPCGTVTGPAVLSERSGAPLVPMFCYWTGPNRYHIEILPELEPVQGYPYVEGMTRAVNLALEGIIRQHPEQYLWIHDRWKAARQQGLI